MQAHPLKHVKRTNIAKVHVTRAKHDLPVDDSEASTSGRSEQADCGRHIPVLAKRNFLVFKPRQYVSSIWMAVFRIHYEYRGPSTGK